MDPNDPPTRTAAWKGTPALWVAYVERFLRGLLNLCLRTAPPLFVGIRHRILQISKQVYLSVEQGKIFLKTTDLARKNKIEIAGLGEMIFDHRDTKGRAETLQDKIISQYIRDILDHQKKLSHMRNPPVF